MSYLALLDYAAVLIFALTGALVASRLGGDGLRRTPPNSIASLKLNMAFFGLPAPSAKPTRKVTAIEILSGTIYTNELMFSAI